MSPFFNLALKFIDDRLKDLLSNSPILPYASLFESARYSLLSSGKRLRPLLVLATVETYNIPLDRAWQPACALEMIHTYSLIHDDLPSMDDDDLRRGKPTLHKMYPEWQALLTGDYLLTYAFEILSNAPHLTPEQKIALVRSLSSRAGAHGMIGGQMIDLLSEGHQVDWDIVQLMHRKKTGGLILAALEFGGIIANAPESDRASLAQAAEAIGLAFQLIDDVLDDTGVQEEMGKPIGSDRENNKATAVSLFGISTAQEKAQGFLQTAKTYLDTLSRPAPLLHELFDKMVHRQK